METKNKSIKMSKLKSNLMLFLLIFSELESNLINAAPQSVKVSHNWPYMPTYDIWGSGTIQQTKKSNQTQKNQINLIRTNNTNSIGLVDVKKTVDKSFKKFKDEKLKKVKVSNFSSSSNKTARRNSKVLNFFPLPVDDECISDDGRRVGLCLNTYECSMQGGSSKGSCALGFGVCCIFEATCDQEINNNITYFVSPNFPALLPHNQESCNIKVRLLSDDISQLRFDFIHFTLGQPNRATGICESDLFSIEGGPSPFGLCGQNSGQHLYYDVGNSKGRADSPIELVMKFGRRAVMTRLWEIQVLQIPFSQRAPSGCLQYFTGSDGVIQTFNFAENGRHLANQDYKACVRQETGMCSIAYEPCDDQSFRIGPMRPMSMRPGNGMFGPGGATMADDIAAMGPGTLADAPLGADGNPLGPDGNPLADDPSQIADTQQDTPVDGEAADGGSPADGGAPDGGTPDGGAPDGGSPADAAQDAAQADQPQADDPQSDTQADDAAEEGSGGGGGFLGFPAFPSFPSLPSFPSFFSRSDYWSFRKARNHRRSRQLYSPCVDRITMPCIVEDFIGAGMGDIPTCIPVHCGNSMCQSGISSCRVETSVTPFAIGVHFGNGTNKGSPEDNIGACLRYRQTACSDN